MSSCRAKVCVCWTSFILKQICYDTGMKFEFSNGQKEQVAVESEQEALSKVKYEKIASHLGLIVNEVYGYEIPRATMENWEKLGFIAAKIDNLLDTSSEEERENIVRDLRSALSVPHEELPENLAGIKDEILLLEGIRQGLSQERRIFFERVIKMLLDATQAIKKEANLKKAIHLTSLEGQISAKLYLALLPDSFQEKERYREMSNLISRIARIGNIFDTAVDLPRDFQDGQTFITPTIFHRAAFIGAALSQGIKMDKKGLFNLKTIKTFFQATSKVVRDTGK